MSMLTLGTYGPDLAKRRWFIHPLHTPSRNGCTCWKGDLCPHPGKHPRINGWEAAATTDLGQIAAWARRWPEANIGIACGPSGLVVLDCDPRNGGDESLFTLTQRYGRLPETPTVLTGGGGQHSYFMAPSGRIPNAVGLGDWPGLDLRSAGGLVVAVGSLHESGRRYEWEASSHPDDLPLAPMPQWLIDLARQSNPGKHKAAPVIPDIVRPGQRNATLFSLGGTMRRRGMSEAAIRAALLVTNQERCQPPLETREVEALAASVARYAPDQVPQRASKPIPTFTLSSRVVSAEEVARCLR